jgi:hypothetical protein
VPLEPESKAPKPAKVVYIREESGGDTVKEPAKEKAQPKKLLHASCSAVARTRETDLLSPACEKLPRSARGSVSRDH